MRIESVESIFVDKYLFVEVRTDTGTGRPGRRWSLGFSRSHRRRRAPVQGLPARPGSAADRAPLAIHVPLGPLPRLGGDGGDQRHRHRALGHRGQALRRAGARTAGRQGPREGAGLLSRVRRNQGGTVTRASRSAKKLGFTAVGHLTPFLDTRAGGALLPDARPEDRRRGQDRGAVPQDRRAGDGPVHRNPPADDAV